METRRPRKYRQKFSDSGIINLPFFGTVSFMARQLPAVSMARAFIRLVAIATCFALSLTAEERQARSGDLDRGPDLEKRVYQVNNLKESYENSYPENLHGGTEEEIFNQYINWRPNLRTQLVHSNNSPLLKNSQEKILVDSDISSKDYDRKIYIVQEIPEKKAEDGNSEYFLSKFGRLGDYQLDKSEFLESFDDKKKLGSFSGQGEFDKLQVLAKTNILDRVSNLRFKLPFGSDSAFSPLTVASASPLKQGKRRMRSDTLEFSNLKNISNRSPSEVSFEMTDEEAMALKRRVELSTEFFLIPSSSTPATSTQGVYITRTVNPEDSDKLNGVFRNEVWVIPLIALSAVTMILIASFEVFVLCKAWRTTPSRRHLFLGQMLLFGLFSCAGLASIIAASPTQFTCALMRFGTGVAYAIVFASLLVKCVFLISLNGGVYLPAPYQGLLLLFAILIQVAIGVQWLLTNPPLVESITVEHVMQQNKNRLLVTAADISNIQVVSLCSTPYVDMVLSLIYVIFLIIFVTVLAVKSRSIRDNYREATYIGLSVGCSIPTWLIWTVSGLVVHERHRDACIAFGLVIISIMVFLIMFMPKGRQLAAMGKEGVYVEDREDRFSSLSRTGSGYSPSFFHFKPVKYGMNNGSKHQHITTLGGGGGDSFWARWVKEYLPTLNKRNKWTYDEKSIQIEDNLPRHHWKLGRIMSTYPGPDGRVRVVDVKTASGLFRSPVTKL